MAWSPLFPEHEIGVVRPAAPCGVEEPPPVATDAARPPIYAARAATLPQLADLWTAGEIVSASDGNAAVSSGFPLLDAELPGGGWPAGQLIELLFDAPGIGELSLLTPALAHRTQDSRACVWVLPCEHAGATALPIPYPPALAAAGNELSRTLFVQPETPREAFWAIEQALRAAHLGALIGWLPPTSSSREGEFRALRRLQLLAARRQALVFLLREGRARPTPSPAALRLQLTAVDGDLSVTIMKRRGRPLLDPLTLQVRPAHWKTAAADGAAAVRPQSSSRVAAAAAAARVCA